MSVTSQDHMDVLNGLLSPGYDGVSLTNEQEDELLNDELMETGREETNRLTNSNFNQCIQPEQGTKEQDNPTNEQSNRSVQFKTLAARNLLSKRNVTIKNEEVVDNSPEASMMVVLPSVPVDTSSSMFAGVSDALENVAVGADNEYQVKMSEQQAKREQIRKWKEERRLQSCDERMENVKILQVKINKLKGSSRFQKPYERVKKGSVFERLQPRPVDPVVEEHCQDLNQNKKRNYIPMERLEGAKKKLSPFEPNKPNHQCSSTVVIEGLAPITNEYSLSALCQTVGKVVSCGVVIENGQRVGRAHFVASRDAVEFQRRYNQLKLDDHVLRMKLA